VIGGSSRSLRDVARNNVNAFSLVSEQRVKRTWIDGETCIAYFFLVFSIPISLLHVGKPFFPIPA
jgi:hypothetical protein